MKTFANYRNSALVLHWIVSGCFLLAPNVVFAQKPAQRPYLAPSLIAPEVKALNSFTKPLKEFSTETETLRRKAKITRQEKGRVTAKAKLVKDMIPSVKRNFESVIEKIKSAGKWTPELDAYTVEQISKMEIPSKTKNAFIDLLKQNGGARAVLETAVQELSGAEKDIDGTLHDIEQKQLASWLFGTAYASPKWGFWKCLAVLAIGAAGGMAGQVNVAYGAAIAAASNCFD
jgi:hypothetical protein